MRVFHVFRCSSSIWLVDKNDSIISLSRPAPTVPNEGSRPAERIFWVKTQLIESWWREKKWPACRIARELADGQRFICCVRTVTGWLDGLGLNRIRDITPDGENFRSPEKITARDPGHMVHMDVKKVGKLRDGGG